MAKTTDEKLDEILAQLARLNSLVFTVFSTCATMLQEQRASAQSSGAFDVQILGKLDEILAKLPPS